MSTDKELGVEMYRRMRLIRAFEETVESLINTGEIWTISHLYMGQEAVAVGVCSALGPGDCIASTHRGHGHILAKGGDPGRMMAELFGRITGYNRGKGGTMHIADLSLGILGANGIVGAGVPIAAGAAWASRVKGDGEVAVAFFGDGAINQGVVHETMNMAAIWDLPVVFVCENNQYAIGTPIKHMCPVPIHQRAQAYGFPGIQVDGMDVEAVFSAAREAVGRARSLKGPTLLVCETFRFRGHWTGEERFYNPYRNQEEIETWRKRDPLLIWGSRLEERGVLSEAERNRIDTEIQAQVDKAVEFAKSSPMPELETALEDMYAHSHPGLPARGWL